MTSIETNEIPQAINTVVQMGVDSEDDLDQFISGMQRWFDSTKENTAPDIDLAITMIGSLASTTAASNRVTELLSTVSVPLGMAGVSDGLNRD